MAFDYRRNPELPLPILAARRMIQGCEYISRPGRIVDVDATISPADVWAGGGLYTGFLDAADDLEVFSDSVEDNPAGIGMGSFRTFGLDAEYAGLNEDVILDGTTPVPLTQPYLRLHQLTGKTAGTASNNTGTITVRSIATPTNVLAVIAPGVGSTEQATWTVPAARYAVVQARTVSATRVSGAGAKLVSVAWWTRRFGDTCWRCISPINVSTDAGAHVAGLYSNMIKLNPKDDMVLRIISATAAGLTITGDFDVYHYPFGGVVNPSTEV